MCIKYISCLWVETDILVQLWYIIIIKTLVSHYIFFVDVTFCSICHVIKYFKSPNLILQRLFSNTALYEKETKKLCY